MPRVQSYGQRNVAPRPIAGVKHSPDAAAVAGESLARLGGQVADAASYALQGIQAQRDRADGAKAHNDLQERRLQLVLSARDIKGEASFDLAERYEREFEDFASGIEKNIKSGRVRQQFASLRANELGALRIGVASHVGQERERYYAEQHARGAELALSDVIANVDDPDLRNRAFRLGEAKTRDGLAGQSPEAVAAGVLEFQTKAHQGVIMRLLATNQDRKARVYFEEAKSQIDGRSLPDIERALEQGTTLGESQRQSDAIVAAGGTLTEQRDKAKAIDDPEVRQRTLQLIEHEASVRAAEAQANEENLMVTAGNLVDKGGLKAVTADILSRLTPSQKMTLESYAKRNQTGGAGSSDAEMVRFYQMKQLAASDPAAFAKVNLQDLIGKLDKTEFKHLVDLQMDIREGKGAKAEAALDGFRTDTQIFNDTIVSAGIEDGTPEAASLRRKMDAQVEALQRLSGKKATNVERQQIADDLLKSVVIEQGSWWNVLPGGRSFTDVTRRVSDLSVSDIPANEQNQIKAALRSRGQVITDEAIVNLYLATKRRLGAVK